MGEDEEEVGASEDERQADQTVAVGAYRKVTVRWRRWRRVPAPDECLFADEWGPDMQLAGVTLEMVLKWMMS